MDIFKLVGSVMVDNSKANDSLSKTSKAAQGAGGKLASMAGTAAKAFAGIAAAAAAVGAACFKMASDAAANLDKVHKGAQELSISYESYQKLAYAAERSGTSIDSLSKGIKNITNSLADAANGSEKATATFDAMGVSLQDDTGAFKTNEQVLQETLLALADMEDETQRNALANDIFGQSYQDLLPLLNQGSEGIEDLMQNCEDLGLVMSDESVEAGAAFSDQLADVKDAFTSIKNELGVQLMPVIMKVMEWITDHMPEIRAVVDDISNFIRQNVENLKPVIDALRPIVEQLFQSIGFAWNNILKPVLTTITEFIGKIFAGDIKGAFEGLVKNVAKIWEGLKDAIKAPINAVIGIINRFLGSFGSIKIPDWIPIIGGNTFSFPQIPLLASGGEIRSGGSAIVGEAGAELVDLPAGATVSPLGSNAVIDYNRMAEAFLVALRKAAPDLQSNVVIQGNARSIFDVVQEEARKYKKTTGRYAFA